MQGHSAADVKYDLEQLRHDIALEENEDTWERISKSMLSFVRISEGACETAPAEVVNALRAYARPIISAMASERTRLSGTALDLLTSTAAALSTEFEQLLPLFFPPLLALCARTNKVVVGRARATIMAIIESTQLVSVLTYLAQSLKDKSASLRMVIADCTLACLNSCNPPDLERENRAKEIEAIIRGSARDANADVRKVSRKIFESYKILFPSRVDSFTAPLTPTMKKYLDIKNNAAISSSNATRPKLDLKPTNKPSASNIASTSAPTRPTGHTRTISVPNASQSRNLATSLTRVSRKDLATTSTSTTQAPRPPIRPAHPTRIVSEALPPTASSVATTTTRVLRAPPPQGEQTANPPLRTQRSVVSQSTVTTSSTVAPHRMVLKPGSKIEAGPSTNTHAGPRRVPIPPPPSPPLATEQKEKIPPRRPPPATDAPEPSNKRTLAPPAAPAKKAATASSSSLRRPAAASATTAAPSTTVVPKINSKSSSSSLKPKASTASLKASGSSTIASKTKVTAPPAPPVAKPKPLWGRGAPPAKPPASSQRGAASKSVVAKPSSRVVSGSSIASSRNRAVTPALVALPPSPTPSTAASTKASENLVENSPQPAVQAQDAEVSFPDEADVEHQSKGVSLGNGELEEVEQENAKDVPKVTATASNFTGLPLPVPLPIPKSEVFATLELRRDPIPLTPFSFSSSSKAFDGSTPQAGSSSQGLSSTKTPISALLFSIERGFSTFSPNSPLSPPDGYANGNIPVHPPRSDGPMLPFNHALHTPSITYGNKNNQRAEADSSSDTTIHGVKLFGLGFGLGAEGDNGARSAFIEINQ